MGKQFFVLLASFSAIGSVGCSGPDSLDTAGYAVVKTARPSPHWTSRLAKDGKVAVIVFASAPAQEFDTTPSDVPPDAEHVYVFSADRFTLKSAQGTSMGSIMMFWGFDEQRPTFVSGGRGLRADQVPPTPIRPCELVLSRKQPFEPGHNIKLTIAFFVDDKSTQPPFQLQFDGDVPVTVNSTVKTITP